jgi:glycosyltransferase involved in cell wall biosynthesis
MKNDIRISVALVTRNRPEPLRRCLASLRAQGVQPFEVVVSDDSDDAFSNAAREVAEQFDCRYTTGPRRGLYANRNSAALQCTGTHVRTMDDDHTFPPGHFEQCFAAVLSDPRAVWTTGETSFLGGKFFDKSETATQLHPSGVGGPVADPDDNWAVADGSTVYPREIFARGLRMVEDFGYGSGYLEFGAFIYRHGFRSRCVRGAFVEHHADAATLTRRNIPAALFASLCFNLHFRRNLPLAARYAASYALLRQPSLAFRLPSLLKKARNRWNPTE